jgi:hypothetical protein
MAIGREELAKEIYSFCYVKPGCRSQIPGHVTPKQAFRAADHFLKEVEMQGLNAGLKQAKEFAAQHNEEPPEMCGHSKLHYSHGVARCLMCMEVVFTDAAPKPEPPKPCQCGGTYDPHWKTYDGVCAHCGGKVKTEPAPKREARKFWVDETNLKDTKPHRVGDIPEWHNARGYILCAEVLK